MAAHTYRTWLWNQVGFATWNAQWYGGHHMAGYSLLYPPLAALAGTRFVGVAAAVAAVGAVRPARAPARADAGRRGARHVAVPRRRDEQRGDRPHAVHARDRARRRRVGVRAALARRRGGALARERLGEPRHGRVPRSSPRSPCSPARGRGGDAARRLAHRARARRARRRRRPGDGGAVPRGRLGPLRRHRVLADAARLPRRARAGRPDAPHGDLGGGDLRRGARRRVRDPEPARPERAAARRRARARAARAVHAAARAARGDRR